MSLTAIERAAGLTAPLPAGETILWQGKPVTGRMAASVFHLRGVGVYFGVAAMVILFAALRAGRPLGQAIAEATLLIPFALASFGLLALIGRMSARATTYTLTNRRIILHIGVAYEMTVSIPLSAVTDASLRRAADGINGDIALSVSDTGGTGYVALWPHARPWRLLAPQPMLRALDDVEAVADRIGDALVVFNTSGRRAMAAPQPSAPAFGEAVAA